MLPLITACGRSSPGGFRKGASFSRLHSRYSEPMDDPSLVEYATTDEILQELATRCDAFLFMAVGHMNYDGEGFIKAKTWGPEPAVRELVDFAACFYGDDREDREE